MVRQEMFKEPESLNFNPSHSAQEILAREGISYLYIKDTHIAEEAIDKLLSCEIPYGLDTETVKQAETVKYTRIKAWQVEDRILRNYINGLCKEKIQKTPSIALLTIKFNPPTHPGDQKKPEITLFWK